LDRLLQIQPKYVFMDDGAVYNGKKIDLREKMQQISDAMADVPNFKGIIAQPRFSSPLDIRQVSHS
jgi:acetoacetyl-CoA synthetase